MDTERIEKKWGGILACVAIIAAVLELITGGVSTDSVFGTIKDIAATAVAAIVLFAIIPKRKSFDERLRGALENWISENSNMLFRNSRMDKAGKNESDIPQYGIGMRPDITNFFNGKLEKNPEALSEGEPGSGLFVRLPAISEQYYSKPNIRLEFHLNKGTFFGRGTGPKDTELSKALETRGKLFEKYINDNTKFSDFAEAKASGRQIIVTIGKAIKSDRDIERLIDLLNTMYQAYLVAAHIQIKDQ